MDLIEFHYGVKDYNILMPPTSLCAFFRMGSHPMAIRGIQDMLFGIINLKIGGCMKEQLLAKYLKTIMSKLRFILV